MSSPRPQLQAKFRTNAVNEPEYSERDGLRHYQIELYVKDLPQDTYGVTYSLHETYYNPIRDGDPREKFATEITSYGDYRVAARISRKSGVDTATQLLSRMLQAHYAENGKTSPSIAKAIDYIIDH